MKFFITRDIVHPDLITSFNLKVGDLLQDKLKMNLYFMNLPPAALVGNSSKIWTAPTLLFID